MFFLLYGFMNLVLTLFAIAVLIVGYAISAIGYNLLFRAYGYEKPSNGWIPLYNEALFLQRELRLPEYVKWLLTFYFAGCFIPYIGSIMIMAGYFAVAGLSCKYIYSNGGSALEYLCAFFLRPLLPFLWIKNARTPDIID